VNHFIVFVKTPYVPEPIGVRVKDGLIIDSDPRLAFAQGRSLLWFREWLRRRPQRGWYEVRNEPLNDSPPIEMTRTLQ
jgi:hypothetical protein